MKHCGRAACTNDLSGMRSDADWCSRACYIAVKRGDKPYIARTGGPSGLQVSYRKAVKVAADALAAYHDRMPRATIEAWADELMREALSDRQRARLDARDG